MQPAIFRGSMIFYGEDPSTTMTLYLLSLDEFSVKIQQSGYLRSYPDGSQLFRCEIENLSEEAIATAGKCEITDAFDISIELRHFTSSKNADSIQQSSKLWGSASNLQGNSNFKAVDHVYFTDLTGPLTEQDLLEIAMSEVNRETYLAETEYASKQKIVLPRRNLSDMEAVIELLVPVEYITPKHLILNDSDYSNQYYESVLPLIQRVKLAKGQHLNFHAGVVPRNQPSVEMSSYTILNRLTAYPGFAGILDERDPKNFTKMELLAEENVFEAWKRFANSDRYSNNPSKPEDF